ncbi:glycosyltransferase [Actinobacillus porcinus]|uniref:glycosyltransferase n=1 Tax=Actinobacillus porcinus TaxID=51048 RepID=UPI002A9185C5|nr:glycosyltransferase [Actinobacillus porcinus]MDY5420495.1 glycosyltransferase [Actinobacillus porcinus]
MKNILIYRKNMKIGGITTVLLNYLNILAQHPDYHIDLVIVDQPPEDMLAKVPNNINVHHILSYYEAEFETFCLCELVKTPDDYYFASWHGGLKDFTRKKVLEYLNSRPPYDLIINFAGDFDDFLNHYDLHSHTQIMRICHSNNDLGVIKQNPLFYKNVFRKQQLFGAIAEDMKSILEEIINQQEEPGFNLNKPVHCLYNPIQLQLIRDKMGENNDPLLTDNYIVAVSGLFNGKGYHQMINIYHQLKQKGMTQKLYIIGEGYLREELTQQINTLGLENDCLLLGKKDNPFPYMKNAKLLIHTSEGEGLPTVLIEAMTCGTPVVAFDCPTGPREILADGQYGGLIPMGNNERFVETVYELLTNENKRQAYIEKLPEAIARFDIETIKPQIYQLIDHLLNKETV